MDRTIASRSREVVRWVHNSEVWLWHHSRSRPRTEFGHPQYCPDPVPKQTGQPSLHRLPDLKSFTAAIYLGCPTSPFRRNADHGLGRRPLKDEP